MAIRCRTLLGTLLATTILHAAAGDLIIRGGVGAFYGVPLARGIYDPWYDFWIGCTLPYRCFDPWQMRIELERDRRMQELRERATPSAHIYRPGDGPWGQQPYIPPATPEANIQPAYRSTSQLRPEYQQSAQPIGKAAAESLK